MNVVNAIPLFTTRESVRLSSLMSRVFRLVSRRLSSPFWNLKALIVLTRLVMARLSRFPTRFLGVLV